MAVDIDSLQIEIEATSSDAAAKIDALATALTNLKAAAKGGAGLTTVSKQMQALASAAASLNNTGIGKLRKIAPALNALSSVQKSSGLSSTVNALSKLSSVSESLKGNSIKEFASQMNQVASAMRPLATEMQKVSNGFSAFPIRIQKIIQSNTGLSASNNKAAKSFGVLGTGISSTTAKLGIYYLAFQRVANMASDWIKSANDYIVHFVIEDHSTFASYDETVYFKFNVEADTKKSYAFLKSPTGSGRPDRDDWSAVIFNQPEAAEEIRVSVRDQDGTLWSFDDANTELWYLVE